MSSIEKILGLLLVSGIGLTLLFIVADISKMAYRESGGFKKYIFNKIKERF